MERHQFEALNNTDNDNQTQHQFMHNNAPQLHPPNNTNTNANYLPYHHRPPPNLLLFTIVCSIVGMAYLYHSYVPLPCLF